MRVVHAPNADHGGKKSSDGKDAAVKKDKRMTTDTRGEQIADADQLGERTLSSASLIRVVIQLGLRVSVTVRVL